MCPTKLSLEVALLVSSFCCFFPGHLLKPTEEPVDMIPLYLFSICALEIIAVFPAHSLEKFLLALVVHSRIRQDETSEV